MEDPSEPFGRLSPDWYMGDLLTLAHDLADRLLVAFATENGIPHPRVNLLHGVPEDGYKESCTAGIGSLILELGMLSRWAIFSMNSNSMKVGRRFWQAILFQFLPYFLPGSSATPSTSRTRGAPSSRCGSRGTT